MIRTFVFGDAGPPYEFSVGEYRGIVLHGWRKAPVVRGSTRAATEQLYRYAWDRCGRKDQICTVPVWGFSMNSCLVRFGDGFTMVTSRNALRKHAGATDQDGSGARAPSA